MRTSRHGRSWLLPAALAGAVLISGCTHPAPNADSAPAGPTQSPDAAIAAIKADKTLPDGAKEEKIAQIELWKKQHQSGS